MKIPVLVALIIATTLEVSGDALIAAGGPIAPFWKAA